MSKAKKPNTEALRTAAQSRVENMPAESAGGRLDYSDEQFAPDEEETAGAHVNKPTGAAKPMGAAMTDKKGNQPTMKPKR